MLAALYLWQSIALSPSEVLATRARQDAAVELLRSKSDPCAHAASQVARFDCVTQEFRTTTTHYTSFLLALGVLMRAPTRLKPAMITGRISLDDAESAWTTYRNLSCSSLVMPGYDLNPAVVSCQMELTQRHLQELRIVYAGYLL